MLGVCSTNRQCSALQTLLQGRTMVLELRPQISLMEKQAEELSINIFFSPLKIPQLSGTSQLKHQESHKML